MKKLFFTAIALSLTTLSIVADITQPQPINQPDYSDMMQESMHCRELARQAFHQCMVDRGNQQEWNQNYGTPVNPQHPYPTEPPPQTQTPISQTLPPSVNQQ